MLGVEDNRRDLEYLGNVESGSVVTLNGEMLFVGKKTCTEEQRHVFSLSGYIPKCLNCNKEVIVLNAKLVIEDMEE